jgi:hypothetical protein
VLEETGGRTFAGRVHSSGDACCCMSGADPAVGANSSSGVERRSGCTSGDSGWTDDDANWNRNGSLAGEASELNPAWWLSVTAPAARPPVMTRPMVADRVDRGRDRGMRESRSLRRKYLEKQNDRSHLCTMPMPGVSRDYGPDVIAFRQTAPLFEFNIHFKLEIGFAK